MNKSITDYQEGLMKGQLIMIEAVESMLVHFKPEDMAAVLAESKARLTGELNDEQS